MSQPPSGADDADVSARLRQIFETLQQREDPPRPWTGPGEVPWTDPQFSRDYARAAARDNETTEDEFNFIASSFELPLHPAPAARWNILDLGCGDGRLLIPFARLGHAGYGIDLGPSPIEDLRERAARHDLKVEAIDADLRDWASGKIHLGPEGRFHALLLSFGTLAGFPPQEASQILERCRDVLGPNGWLYLDMGLSAGFAHELDEVQEWWTAEDFVLGPGPQLVLDDHSYDPVDQVYVRRSFAIHLGENPRMGEVRQTSRLYEGDELRVVLERCGFEVVEMCGDFLDAPYDPDISENLVVIARKSS